MSDSKVPWMYQKVYSIPRYSKETDQKLIPRTGIRSANIWGYCRVTPWNQNEVPCTLCDTTPTLRWIAKMESKLNPLYICQAATSHFNHDAYKPYGYGINNTWSGVHLYDVRRFLPPNKVKQIFWSHWLHLDNCPFIHAIITHFFSPQEVM